MIFSLPQVAEVAKHSSSVVTNAKMNSKHDRKWLLLPQFYVAQSEEVMRGTKLSSKQKYVERMRDKQHDMLHHILAPTS